VSDYISKPFKWALLLKAITNPTKEQAKMQRPMASIKPWPSQIEGLSWVIKQVTRNLPTCRISPNVVSFIHKVLKPLERDS